jgi:hypothetical protein
MTIQELKQAGALIYACEGTGPRKDPRSKNRYIYSIEFTNSKPQLIKLFAKFLRKILKIDESRLRGQLFTYPDHNKEKLINFWSQTSGIPNNQFQKVIELKQKNPKFKPNPNGTFKIRYSCKSDFLKLEKITNEIWRDAKVA